MGPVLLGVGLLAAAGPYRIARESEENAARVAERPGPGNAPRTASREVCEEKARKYREVLRAARQCRTSEDCEATSALQFGQYNTTNCLTPLNPAGITPEMRAVAADYHDACSRGCRRCRSTWPKAICAQGECAWEE